MKRYLGLLLGLLVLMTFVSSAEAAINIDEATIQNGQVFIAGDQAQRRAAISWEGVAVGKNTTAGGAFTFNTTNLPADCVGKLKIGTEERDVVINNCTPAPITIIEAGVPKTGQTTSFATGDDGDLEKGVALPNPRFTDNGNGTITDNLTGLIWLQNANCRNGFSTWEFALNDVADLNAAGTMNSNSCGDTSNAGSHQTDWRLPNVRELHSLADYGQSTTLKLPSGQPFTNFDPSNYWSSTIIATSSILAWTVNFNTGEVFPHIKDASNFRVTAVRGGS